MSDKRPTSPLGDFPAAKQPKLEVECIQKRNYFHPEKLIGELNHKVNGVISNGSGSDTLETNGIDANGVDSKSDSDSCQTDSRRATRRSVNASVNGDAEQVNGDDQKVISDVERLNGHSLGNKLKLRELRVKLEHITVQRKTEQKLTTARDSKKPDVYEVEKVLRRKFENGVSYYLIKWKDWDSQFNTWEPIKNLTNCDEMMKEFEESRVELLEKFQKNAGYYPDTSELEKHMQGLLGKGQSIDSTPEEVDLLYDKIETFFKVGPSKCTKLVEKIKRRVLHMSLSGARNEQLESLRVWEIEMNRITKGKPSIKVENTVDLERAPQEFLYIDDYLPGSGVIIPDEPPIGCECETCDSKTKCCYAMCDGGFPYTSAYRIRVPPGTPIYECNKRCVCPADCANRVVQRGSHMKLCVFRTANGRGWGVKTLRGIKKGSFVIQYVGEVITNEEAEKRGEEYDAAGRTYLFDLDYNETEEQCPYTVDAAVYGNISHFINHSCDPNLAVYAVWINCLDPNLPKLALFAVRDIKQNEELTFDYMRQVNKDDSQRQRLDLADESASSSSEKGRTRCKCGADKCRQYLF